MANKTDAAADVGFIHARTKKKRKNRRALLVSAADAYARTRDELAADDWLAKSQSCLDVCLNKHTFKPTRVLCLGLGSPSSSRDARAQLAYLMHTVKWLEIEHSRVTVCDPVFTDDDRALFDETGIIHIQPTELEHELALNQPTLLYMPHCDRDLYERVYASNRSKRELGNLLLIGNELEAYATAGSKKELEQKAQQILKILPYLSSYLLPRSDAFYTAFQGTSVQIVSVDAAPPEFWEHEEPEKIDSVEAQVDAHTV